MSDVLIISKQKAIKQNSCFSSSQEVETVKETILQHFHHIFHLHRDLPTIIIEEHIICDSLVSLSGVANNLIYTRFLTVG